jgi:uncharacterized protein YcbK (DUF882 family)
MMDWSRRRLLKTGGAVAIAVATWPAAPAATATALGADAKSSAAAPSDQKRIALTNLHTGEHLQVEYFRNGDYSADALGKIEVVLRDWRNDERHAIDPKLMDYLVEVAAKVGVAPSFSVICGYRSPVTNAKLHENSSGVAQHSLHMQGRAIDVRMGGVDCADLAARALDLKRGGVGYYRASNFVHLDTGAFRTWRG